MSAPDMFETRLAETAYAHSARSTASPRALEYQVFARVTRALSVAGEGFDRFALLYKAIDDNLILWTKHASDVAVEKNQLSAELRSKIFYLFEFTRQHSAKVLNDGADPSVLVDINTAVMRGLRVAATSEESA
ncbi:MAG: flagellar biosynthesis regulator FlaF [Amphiplicatus sp.]